MDDKPVYDPADGSPAATDPPETTVDTDRLAVLQRERDEYYDRLLRKTAEFDNYRKRIERERREQADQAVVDLLQELLLVVDDFDLALTVDADETAGPYKKGIELIHAKLHDLLKKYGVHPIETIDANFDTNRHHGGNQHVS